jgi:glutaredoxin
VDLAATGPGDDARRLEAPVTAQVSREIVVVSTSDCRFCTEASELVSRLSAEFRLRVREVDLGSAEGIAALRTWDVPFPPIVLVDGNLFGYGRISERRLRRHLTRTGA